MLTVTATFDQSIVYFFAANLAALLICVLVLRERARRTRKHTDAITHAAAQFFRDSGGEVAVECVAMPNRAGYVAFIDTGSSKRFRYSHIVELILIDYVRENCGLPLAKVYWRFPIKSAHDMPMPSPETKPAEEFHAAEEPHPAKELHAAEPKQVARIAQDIDDYLTEGMLRLKKVPGYEVSEASLENYQEFLARR
jgi:hypothetical protein